MRDKGRRGEEGRNEREKCGFEAYRLASFAVRVRDATPSFAESSQRLRFETITFASEHSCEAEHVLTSPENLLDAFSEL